MKITENWTGTIERIQYKSMENKSKFSQTESPMLYMCPTTIAEVGRGLTKFKQRHNVVFYLTQQQFDEKILEKGDRVEIKEGAKWQVREIKYNSYKPDIISKMDTSKLMRDEFGKTYSSETLYCYKIVCKEGDWEIKKKWYDRNHCTIVNSGIKLPLEDKQQFTINDKLDWFLEPEEYKKLIDFNNTTQKVIAYADNNKVGEKTMLVQLVKDDENNTFSLFLQGVTE